MSTATLAPFAAIVEPVSPAPADDPIARFRRQLSAGLALSKLERDVQRIEDRFYGNPPRTYVWYDF